MSLTVLTAAFGPTDRWHDAPRSVRVFAQLVVGGSGIYLFHLLGEEPRTLRLRPADAGAADTLMSGFALTDPSLDLTGQAAALAEHLRTADREVLLTARDAEVLADAVADRAVSVVLTGVGIPPLTAAAEFRGWRVYAGTAD